MKRLIPFENHFSFILGLLLCALSLTPAHAQTDPGPRLGPASAGGPIKGLNPQEEKLFWKSWERFKETYSVSGKLEKGVGLGPTFNGNSCAQCHAQPAAGGSSPSPRSPQVRRVVYKDERLGLDTEPNPQIRLAGLHRVPGGEQKVPSFISADGPVRVARFIRKADGMPDGQVHEMYTIAGREDADGCVLAQPDFVVEMARHNVVFRIPTPTFGAGMVEAVSDETLIANLKSTAERRRALGIGGRFSRSANDGTINRFGWKAQNKSLLIFAAESFSVEMGVTNEAFPNKRNQTAGCVFNALPEDHSKLQQQLKGNDVYQPSDFTSDVVNFASFMRMTAPPTPATHSPSELNGRDLFAQVGCALCHSPALQTGQSAYGGVSNMMISPYSDFALHHMGPKLADHISQGAAAGDEFRTAPLWGVGQRIFFLHDGRTSDLLAAIQAHASTDTKNCRARARSAADERCTSEANRVIENFQALPPSEKQDILNFLRSL